MSVFFDQRINANLTAASGRAATCADIRVWLPTEEAYRPRDFAVAVAIEDLYRRTTDGTSEPVQIFRQLCIGDTRRKIQTEKKVFMRKNCLLVK